MIFRERAGVDVPVLAGGPEFLARPSDRRQGGIFGQESSAEESSFSVIGMKDLSVDPRRVGGMQKPAFLIRRVANGVAASKTPTPAL